MRIVFEEGKQKELIEEEKNIHNLSLEGLASKMGIKKGKMQAYYYDDVLMPDNLFDKFESRNKFEKSIVERKPDNWGKIKGGFKSQGTFIKNIKNPEESVKLAEFYGIMLGDGNLTKIKKYKIGVYQIRIVGDSRNDKKYLENHVKKLIEELFDIRVNVFKAKNRNALNLSAHGLRLVEFMERKGFKPGDKIKNQLVIPEWIKSNKEYLKACLRGLYDTDGSIYKLTNQNSYQICFTNYNLKLLEDVRSSLVLLGIKPSKITKETDIVITKRSELLRFLNSVGFGNPKHLGKVEMWKLTAL